MRGNLKHLFLLVLIAGLAWHCYAQDEDPEERVYYNKEDNAVCFKCHGNLFFDEYNEELDEQRTRKMFKGLIIDTVKYYDSNHWSFGCTDCHSYDYNTYPHSDELHFEVLPGCEDCHAGDDAMEKYSFSAVVEEYNKSHHTHLPDYEYTCWSCHEPHSFKMEVRGDYSLKTVVANDNGMCLQCHGAVDYAELLLGVSLDPMMEIHDWLPGAENHLRHVRCIECHAEINDSVMVAHNIVPKEQAVKTCAECQASDSWLLHTLYKYQIQEGRIARGVFGALTTGETFVVGSNRNEFLNLISLIIFGALILFFGGHAVLRIILK